MTYQNLKTPASAQAFQLQPEKPTSAKNLLNLLTKNFEGEKNEKNFPTTKLIVILSTFKIFSDYFTNFGLIQLLTKNLKIDLEKSNFKNLAENLQILLNLFKNSEENEGNDRDQDNKNLETLLLQIISTEISHKNSKNIKKLSNEIYNLTANLNSHISVGKNLNYEVTSGQVNDNKDNTFDETLKITKHEKTFSLINSDISSLSQFILNVGPEGKGGGQDQGHGAVPGTVNYNDPYQFQSYPQMGMQNQYPPANLNTTNLTYNTENSNEPYDFKAISPDRSSRNSSFIGNFFGNHQKNFPDEKSSSVSNNQSPLPVRSMPQLGSQGPGPNPTLQNNFEPNHLWTIKMQQQLQTPPAKQQPDIYNPTDWSQHYNDNLVTPLAFNTPLGKRGETRTRDQVDTTPQSQVSSAITPFRNKRMKNSESVASGLVRNRTATAPVDPVPESKLSQEDSENLDGTFDTSILSESNEKSKHNTSGILKFNTTSNIMLTNQSTFGNLATVSSNNPSSSNNTTSTSLMTGNSGKKSVTIDDTLHERTFEVQEQENIDPNETVPFGVGDENDVRDERINLNDLSMISRNSTINKFIDTPLMATPNRASINTSYDSLDQELDDAASIKSEVDSHHESRFQSGMVSPSNLPDSPGQITPYNYAQFESDQKRLGQNMLKKSLFGGKQGQTQAQGQNQKYSQNQIDSDQSSKHKNTTTTDSATPFMPTSNDEMIIFNSEGSMSPMTGLSGLTFESNQSSALDGMNGNGTGQIGFSFKNALQQNNEFEMMTNTNTNTNTNSVLSSDLSDQNLPNFTMIENNLSQTLGQMSLDNTQIQNRSDSAFYQSPDQNQKSVAADQQFNFGAERSDPVESVPSLSALPPKTSDDDPDDDPDLDDDIEIIDHNSEISNSDFSINEDDQKLLERVIQTAQPDHDKNSRIRDSPNKNLSKFEKSNLVERTQRITQMQKLLTPPNKREIKQMIARMDDLMQNRSAGGLGHLDKSFLSKSSTHRSLDSIPKSSSEREFSFKEALKRINSDPTISRNTSTATNLRDTTSPENLLSTDESPRFSFAEQNRNAGNGNSNQNFRAENENVTSASDNLIFNFIDPIDSHTPDPSDGKPRNFQFSIPHSDQISYATSMSNITFDDSSNMNVNFTTTSNSNTFSGNLPFVPVGTPVGCIGGRAASVTENSGSDFQITNIDVTSHSSEVIEYPIFNSVGRPSSSNSFFGGQMMGSENLNYWGLDNRQEIEINS